MSNIIINDLRTTYHSNSLSWNNQTEQSSTILYETIVYSLTIPLFILTAAGKQSYIFTMKNSHDKSELTEILVK